jgi:hypothetical protein
MPPTQITQRRGETYGLAGDRIDTGLPLNSFSVEIETATVGVL